MNQDTQSFSDYCQSDIIPWLYRYVEIEKIHLDSMRKKLKSLEKHNSKWYSFLGKMDTSFVKECIAYSEIKIKSVKRQIRDYQEFVKNNSKPK